MPPSMLSNLHVLATGVFVIIQELRGTTEVLEVIGFDDEGTYVLEVIE